MASLPGNPSEWYAHLTRIARQELFGFLRGNASGGGLPFTVRDMISTLAHDAWAAINKCPRILENVFGYARIVMRYSLINYVRYERARRWVALQPLPDRDDEEDSDPDLVKLAINPWDDVDLAIAGAQLSAKRERYRERFITRDERPTKTRQAEQQARARFENWYLNSKRRRYD